MFKDKIRKYMGITIAVAFGIIIAICAFFVFFKFDKFMQFCDMIFNILKPFIYGSVIAYILRPVCNLIEKKMVRLLNSKTKLKKASIKKISCWSAIIISMLSALLIIYVLIVLIAPQIIDTIYSLIDILPQYFKTSVDFVQAFLSKHVENSDIIEQAYQKVYDTAYKWLNTDLMPNIQVAITGLSTGVVNAVNLIVNILIGIVVSVYLLYNRRKFLGQAKLVIHSVFTESWAVKITRELKFTDRMFSGFINGKLIDSLIIGVLCYIILCITGIPYPMLISLIVGVTNIIPFFGPFIGAVPCTMLIFILDPIKALYFIIIAIVLQFFDGYVLGPKILGNAIGIDSFWVLFSVLFFGGLFGFIGMIIGVPLFAVIYDIIKQLIAYGLKRYGKQDMIQKYQNKFREPEKSKKAGK